MTTHPSAVAVPDYKAAMGRFATGVAIVTTCAPDGSPVGLTINSLNSVSLTPPVLLWSLAQHASTMPAFEAASHFAVHVLASEQLDLAQRFAQRAAHRFEGVAHTLNAWGVPELPGTAATLVCAKVGQHVVGDHTVWFGQVVHCQHDAGLVPLLYLAGRFTHPQGPSLT